MGIIGIKKGLTPVIAIMLLLMVTVSVTGFGFLFFGRVSETAARAGEEELQQQMLQGGLPRIEQVDENKVYVRSAGGVPLTNPTFYVEGRRIDAVGPAALLPGEIGTYVLNEAQMSGLPKVAEVKITTSGFSDSVVAAVRELLANIVPSGSVVMTGMVVEGEEDGILFRNSSGSDVAVITDAGTVGIGTTGPGKNLEVRGAVAIAQGGTAGAIDFEPIAGGASLYTNNAYDSANPTSGWTNTVTFKSGNVGIGTAGPGETLDVSGNIKTNGAIKIYNGATQVGEFIASDTTWLRINQNVAKNIYTPRYIRADGGLYVSDDERIYRSAEDVIRTPGSFIVDGSVGIGTTVPGAKLDVQGSDWGGIINANYYRPNVFQERTEDSGLIYSWSGSQSWPTSTTQANAFSFTFNPGDTNFRTYFYAKFRVIDAEGSLYVGLNKGTANEIALTPIYYNYEPGNDHTDDNLQQQWVIVYLPYNKVFNNAGNTIDFWSTTGDAGTIYDVYVYRSNHFLMANEPVTNNLIVTKNVGIGTTAPLAKLSFGAVGGNQLFHLYQTGNSRYGFGIGDNELRMFSSSGGHISIGTISSGDGTTWSEKMRIENSGNVGIGTTVPVSKLHIHGNYANTGAGGFTLDATDNSDPERYVLRINPFVVGSGMVGYQFQTKSYTGGTNVPLTFDNAGNVGIGTTSPAAGYKLDVQGKIQANAFDVGDITFRSQETQQILWRMFEDEDGLYLENAGTGKVYRFVLEEVK